MGKAPEVDVARAQLKLLIVHGSMERMEAFPVAYYNIIKTKDGVACRPVVQEVIGRAAFLLVFAAIAVDYAVNFIPPLYTSLSDGVSLWSARFILAFGLFSLPIIALLPYNLLARFHAWFAPIMPAKLSEILTGDVLVGSLTSHMHFIVLPVPHYRITTRSQNDPAYKLVSFLASPIAWFFLIGTLEAASLVLCGVIAFTVFFYMMSLKQQELAVAPLAWSCGSILVLFIGLWIMRMRAWNLVTSILENEPVAQTVDSPKLVPPIKTTMPGVHVVGRPRGLGQSAGVQSPVSERPVRTYFPHYSIAGLLLWGLFSLARYIYNLGKQERPKK